MIKVGAQYIESCSVPKANKEIETATDSANITEFINYGVQVNATTVV